MNGLGMYQYTNCYGSPQAAADALKAMGCRWVIIKIGNGIADKGRATTSTYPGAQADAVRTLTDAGLEVWGYHYIYGGVRWNQTQGYYYSGASPTAEADFANAWGNGLANAGLKGYVINAEHEFKGLNQAGRAKAFMDALNVRIPVALSTYRYPTVHKEFPWGAFYASGKIAYHMPQVYQDDGAGQAVRQLTRCIDEYNSYAGIPKLPIVPTGRAYTEGVFTQVVAAEVQGFIDECKRREFSGCSFWVLDHYKNKPMVKAAVDAAFTASPWPAPQPPAPPQPDLSLILAQLDALEAAVVNLALEATHARTDAVKALAAADLALMETATTRTALEIAQGRIARLEAWKNAPLVTQ